MLRKSTAVVVAMNTMYSPDMPFIHWAKSRGLLVIIDRVSDWGNPYKPTGKSIDDVYTCVQKYLQWLDGRHCLKKRIPKELKGKVLACWCKKHRKGIPAEEATLSW